MPLTDGDTTEPNPVEDDPPDTEPADTTTDTAEASQVPDDINRGRRRRRRTDTTPDGSQSDTATADSAPTPPPDSTIVERAAGTTQTPESPSAEREQQIEQEVSEQITDQVVSQSDQLSDPSQVRVTDIRQTESGEFTGDVELTDEGRTAVARSRNRAVADRARNQFARRQLRREVARDSPVDARGVQVTTQGGTFGTTLTQGGQRRQQQALEQDIVSSRFNRRQFADEAEREMGADPNTVAVSDSADGLQLERTVGGESRALIEQAAENTQYTRDELEVTSGRGGLSVRVSDEALREQAAENSEFDSEDFRVVDQREVTPADQRLFREAGVDEQAVSSDAETGTTSRRLRLTDEARREQLREQVEEQYPNAEFEIVDGEGGPTVQFTERFDDDGKFLYIAGGERALEGASNVLNQAARGVIETSAQYGTGAVYDRIFDLSVQGAEAITGQELETRAEAGQFQQASVDVGTGAATALNPLEGALVLDEAGEVLGAGGAAVYNTASGEDPDALSEFQSEAVDAGEFLGEQAYEQVTERPAQTAGIVAGAALSTYGAFRLAGSAGSTAGRATQIVIEPGEELLRYGGRATVSGASRAGSAVARSTSTTRQIRQTLGELNAQRPQVRVVDRDGGDLVQVSNRFDFNTDASGSALERLRPGVSRPELTAPDAAALRNQLSDAATRTRDRVQFRAQDFREATRARLGSDNGSPGLLDRTPTNPREVSDAVLRARDRAAFRARSARADARNLLSADSDANLRERVGELSPRGALDEVPTSRGELSDAAFRARQRARFRFDDFQTGIRARVPEPSNPLSGVREGPGVRDRLPTTQEQFDDALFRARDRTASRVTDARAEARAVVSSEVERVRERLSVDSDTPELSLNRVPTSPQEISDAVLRARGRARFQLRDAQVSARAAASERIGELTPDIEGGLPTISEPTAVQTAREFARGDAAIRIEPGRPPRADRTLDVSNLEIEEGAEQQLREAVDADDFDTGDTDITADADGETAAVDDARITQDTSGGGQIVVSETAAAQRAAPTPDADPVGSPGALALTQGAESINLSPDSVGQPSIDMDTPAGVDTGELDSGLRDEVGTPLGEDVGLDSPLDTGIGEDVDADVRSGPTTDVGSDLGRDLGVDLGADGRTQLDTSLDLGSDLGVDTSIRADPRPNPNNRRRPDLPDFDTNESERKRDQLLFDEAEQRYDFGDIQLR